jgi:ketosteroid isomerase-like protein
MSRENVELTYRAMEAVNRRDLDAFLAFMDPAVEGVPRTTRMEGLRHGHEGVRLWWESMFEVLPDFTATVMAVRDGGDVTLLEVRVEGHGAGSGTPFDETVWQVARWRRGKVIWWQTFDSRAEALEAAGLSE